MAKHMMFYVKGWAEVQEAVACFEKDPERAKQILAWVMKDPDNAIKAVAQMCDHIEESIAAARRAIGVRRMMIAYLAAQGIEGAHLDKLRERARNEAEEEHARRERERRVLEDAFLRGPDAYAWAVRNTARARKQRAK